MGGFAGLDPSAIRTGADRLDEAAADLDGVHDRARQALSDSELPGGDLLARIVERSEKLRSVANELRQRATLIENVRLESNGHVAALTLRNLATRGLDSVRTLTELDDQIARWSGSDNDPILDALISERSDLATDLAVAAVNRVEGVAALTIVELAQRLEISPAQARAILESELPNPYVLTENPWLFQSLGDQATEHLPAGTPLTVETLIALALSGELAITTFVAGSSEQALIDPSGLDDSSLAAYLALLAEREHTFRVGYDYTLDLSDEDAGSAQLDLIALDMQVRQFESDRFGVDHSGDGGPGIHTMLDIIGLIPVLGEWADGLNAGIYAVEGDWVNAGISSAALIPVVGSTATGGRLIAKGTRIAKGLGGTLVDTLQSTDGALIHRIRRADGTIVNVVETADGKILHTAKQGKEALAEAAAAPRVNPPTPAEIKSITEGHAFKKHVVERREFPGVTNADELSEVLTQTVTDATYNGTRAHDGTRFWFNADTGIFVVVNQKLNRHGDLGSIYELSPNYKLPDGTPIVNGIIEPFLS